ncbi:MAG: hypothetical protein EHM48_07815 [Planctomycetaceae bacterium]|nr:MAG: hypothetical protein EHM48_07815 [Planctomycetaceae bacterium]
MNTPNSTNRALRLAGSVLPGMILLAAIIFLLCFFSITKQVCPQWLESVTGRPADRIYSHWSLLVLTGALLVDLIIVTALRVPLSFAYLGTWVSHLGVLVLAVGISAYAARSIDGQCVAVLDDDGAWTTVEEVFVRYMRAPQTEQGSPGLVAVPLHQPFTITGVKYETFGSSGVTKDYICNVSIGSGASASRETISLNHPLQVDSFQISQGAWLPSGENPRYIVFNAASRPGLNVIWTGLAMICIGLPMAFYLKPVLLKRQSAKQSIADCGFRIAD